jgi:hypothetical protein
MVAGLNLSPRSAAPLNSNSACWRTMYGRIHAPTPHRGTIPKRPTSATQARRAVPEGTHHRVVCGVVSSDENTNTPR